MQIYHNPRCQKSRQTLQLLESKGHEPEIVLYLKEKLTIKDLKDILKKLDIKPAELLRKKESLYKEKILGKSLSDNQLIKLMIEFPKLIERPIVIVGNRAKIGRPPESVLEILDS